jgi:hypothetical protein
VLVVAFVILQFYNGAYKRLANEALKHPLVDPEDGSTFGNPLIQDGNGSASVLGSPGPVKMDAALVRVTSMDSGSGNSSQGVVINELSVANSSINMWNVSLDSCRL